MNSIDWNRMYSHYHSNYATNSTVNFNSTLNGIKLGKSAGISSWAKFKRSAIFVLSADFYRIERGGPSWWRRRVLFKVDAVDAVDATATFYAKKYNKKKRLWTINNKCQFRIIDRHLAPPLHQNRTKIHIWNWIELKDNYL